MAISVSNELLHAIARDPWPRMLYHTAYDGATLLTFYFDNDTSAGHSTGGAWTADDQAAFWGALHSWEHVANIRFLAVDNAEAADMIERKILDLKAADGTPLNGRHDFP